MAAGYVRRGLVLQIKFKNGKFGKIQKRNRQN